MLDSWNANNSTRNDTPFVGLGPMNKGVDPAQRGPGIENEN